MNLDNFGLNESSENDCERTKLKEERKLRNKLKREMMKLKRQKERKNKEALLQLQLKGSNVTVITKDVADQLIEAQIFKSNSISSLKYEDFPELGSHCKPKHEEIRDEHIYNTVENKSRKKNSLVKIDMTELIAARKQKPYTLCEASTSSCKNYYSGNTLDSALPKRMQGKHREVPKLKKGTKLKNSIIYDNEVFEKFNINLDDSTDAEQDDVKKITLYCDNTITQQLTDSVQELVKNIVNLQEKLYKRNHLKGKMKKRYVVGFNEVKKYMNLNKIKLIVITTDIKVTNINDALGKMINTIIDLASLKKIPYVFALNRRLLGRLTLKCIPVSCMGILNYDGLEREFYTVLENASEAKHMFIESNLEGKKSNVNEVNLPLLENLKIALV